MKQGRFSGIGMALPRKQTRRAMFLDQMAGVEPIAWSEETFRNWLRFERLARLNSAAHSLRRNLQTARLPTMDALEETNGRRHSWMEMKRQRRWRTG